MSETALETILGIVFIILSLALFIRLHTLSKSKYFRYLFIAIGILLMGFGAYLIYASQVSHLL